MWLVLTWAFRQIVPSGLPLTSLEEFYFLFPVDYGTFHSPNNTNSVRIIGKGNGPRSSGYRWIWIEKDSGVMGRRIVAAGYANCPYHDVTKLPVRWVSEAEIEVRFQQSMYSEVQLSRTYPVC